MTVCCQISRWIFRPKIWSAEETRHLYKLGNRYNSSGKNQNTEWPPKFFRKRIPCFYGELQDSKNHWFCCLNPGCYARVKLILDYMTSSWKRLPAVSLDEVFLCGTTGMCISQWTTSIGTLGWWWSLVTVCCSRDKPRNRWTDSLYSTRETSQKL